MVSGDWDMGQSWRGLHPVRSAQCSFDKSILQNRPSDPFGNLRSVSKSSWRFIEQCSPTFTIVCHLVSNNSYQWIGRLLLSIWPFPGLFLSVACACYWVCERLIVIVLVSASWRRMQAHSERRYLLIRCLQLLLTLYTAVVLVLPRRSRA